ncbi:MAG: hypothetical protein WCT05_05310 [Lentisphaeria bacterium]
MVFFAYWEDFFADLAAFRKKLARRATGTAIFQLGWHYETAERAQQLQQEKQVVQQQLPELELLFLTNSPQEECLLKDLGLAAVYCHQNAFLDERRYPIIPSLIKEYKAIYIARITPFKRHNLARLIRPLKLVGTWSIPEADFALSTLRVLSFAEHQHYVPARCISREINRASTGLCLSAEEGAMFVSAEYLLSGIPAVSTANLGGRECLLPEPYWLRAEDTPEGVAAAVETMIARQLPAGEIRAAMLAKMAKPRQTLCQLLDELYAKQGYACSHARNFRSWFCHKLGLRSSVPPWRRFRHGLLRS